MIALAPNSWFTASELAELNLRGLPKNKRKINERAADEGWAYATNEKGEPLARTRAARGGGLEYHISLLPVSAKSALTRLGMGEKSQPETPSDDEINAHKEAMWSWFSQQSIKTREEAQRRLEIVNKIIELIDNGLAKTAAVEAISSLHKVAQSTVWSWLRDVEGVAAPDRLAYLAPKRKGGGKKAAMDASLWQILVSDYLRPERPTFQSCYDRIKSVALERDIEIPHAKTLKRKLDKEVDKRVIISQRNGAEVLRNTLPQQERTVSHLHAMEMVNIDGHKFDVFVKLPNGKTIRPLMIAIQDVYSRKILAWRVGVSECSVQTRLTFADLFQKYGVPKECVLDNGRSFASKWITGGSKTRFRFKIKEDEPTGLLTSLGIKIHWALPYRGQSKPIERAFRDLCDRISRHPAMAGAYTGNHIDAKPENYGEKAIDFETFKAFVDTQIPIHNARIGRRTETAHGGSFDEAFIKSYAVAPIGKATPEQLRLALLTAEHVSTNRKTGAISLAGNRYWSADMGRYAGKKVTVRFNPDNLHEQIYVYALNGEFIGDVPLLEAAGFNDYGAAKVRARQEADLKKTVRKMRDQQELLAAEEVAAKMSNSNEEPDLPEPQVVRAVPNKIRNGAALAVAEPAPEKSSLNRLSYLRAVD